LQKLAFLGASAQPPFVHASAEVDATAVIGEGTSIWNEAQVRQRARIGAQCVLSKGVYIDVDVIVGDRVKLENRVSVFKGARLESGVFIGPHSCLLNDKRPRATLPGGAIKADTDWESTGVVVEEGAAVGGGCTVLPGVTIGKHAMVGAGSVVTRDVPAHSLVMGNPAREVGKVCVCGGRLEPDSTCPVCRRTYAFGAP
jgi:acetyltransferase-like isoleucine patch superfamily enzyme